jgi:hypothetical protein
MINLNDNVANMPIEEFAKLDPWYWDHSADKYYPNMNIVLIDEASKRNINRKKMLKTGDICSCDFHIPDHSQRPGLVLILPGLKPLVCTVCTNEHRSDYHDFEANIDIIDPIIYPGMHLNPSHVATNRFRYVKDPKMDIFNKIGKVDKKNLEIIVKQFLIENSDAKKLKQNNLATEESMSVLESIDDILDDFLDDL